MAFETCENQNCESEFDGDPSMGKSGKLYCCSDCALENDDQSTDEDEE